jgi:hypothetical protein
MVGNKNYFYKFQGGENGDERRIYKPSAGKNVTKAKERYFGKLLEKLYEYNEKMNNGRELSVVDFFSRLDPEKGNFEHCYEQ